MNDAKIITEVVLITPRLAKTLLARNTHNRSVRESLVNYYASQMEDGAWEFNGEPIIIDENGDIADGQHRLLACVKSGVSFKTLTVTGVPKASFETIDTGASRTGSDVLVIRGLAPELAKICNAAARMAIPFETLATGAYRVKGDRGSMISPKNTAEWVLLNKRMIELAELLQSYGRCGRILPAGSLLFLWYFMDKQSEDEAFEFFDGLLSGANLGPLDPRLIFRTKMESFSRSRVKWTMHAKLGALIRTWNWWRQGKDAKFPGNMFREDSLEGAFKSLLPT